MRAQRGFHQELPPVGVQRTEQLLSRIAQCSQPETVKYQPEITTLSRARALLTIRLPSAGTGLLIVPLR